LRQSLTLRPSCFVPRQRTGDFVSLCYNTARRTLMSEECADLTGRIDRRGFLVTGAGALAAAAKLADGQPAAAQGKTQTNRAAEMPKRALGRTGANVTILSLGTWMSPG